MSAEEDKTGQGEAGRGTRDNGVAMTHVAVNFAEERSAEELENERKQWQDSTHALLKKLNIDVSDQAWSAAIDAASVELQGLSQKKRGSRKREALEWIAEHPNSNLTPEAAPRLLVLCAVKLTSREANQLKAWTETSDPAAPAPSPEPESLLTGPNFDAGRQKQMQAEPLPLMDLHDSILEQVLSATNLGEITETYIKLLAERGDHRTLLRIAKQAKCEQVRVYASAKLDSVLPDPPELELDRGKETLVTRFEASDQQDDLPEQAVQKSKASKPKMAKKLWKLVQKWGAGLLRKAQAPSLESAEEQIVTAETETPQVEATPPTPKRGNYGQTIAEAPSPFFDSRAPKVTIRTLLDRIRSQAAKEPDKISEDWFVPINADMISTFGRDENGNWRDLNKKVVEEAASAKQAEAEMAGAQEEKDQKASALEMIRDFGLDPYRFKTETDEDKAAMWATVVAAFAELRDLPDDRVDLVAADLAIGLGALGTFGVLPPKALCDDMPYNQATDKLYALFDELRKGQELDPELARRTLFTFWRSFWSASLPSSEAEMNLLIDEYQGTLADFLGLFAKMGYLDQQK